MINLVVSDMDGTLLNKHGEISNENIAAIKKLQEHQIMFAVATGRALGEAEPILQKANIKIPMITSNGAQAFDKNGKLLFTHGLTHETVKKIISYLEKRRVYFEVSTTEGVFTTNLDERLEQGRFLMQYLNPELSEDEARQKAAEHLAKLHVKHTPSYHTLTDNPDNPILKIIVIDNRGPEFLQTLADEIHTYDDLTITSSFGNNIEINALNATKGDALKDFTKLYNLDVKNTMVLGDNHNDVSMFQVAGYPVAMENAVPELKEIAKFITTAHHPSGVADAIAHYHNEIFNK